jgi:transcriptional regulator with XRE-family HTH domain
MAMKSKYPKNYLKEIRTNRGMTLQQVADHVGVTNPYISMIELGKRGISWLMLKKLSAALQCHPLDITEGPGSQNTSAPCNDTEQQLLKTFRGLSDGEKQMFVHMLDTFAPKRGARRGKARMKRGRRAGRA